VQTDKEFSQLFPGSLVGSRHSVIPECFFALNVSEVLDSDSIPAYMDVATILVDHLEVLHEAFSLTQSDFIRLDMPLVAQDLLEKVFFFFNG
jgi:hypothetical protein